jgi:hypothetical protein
MKELLSAILIGGWTLLLPNQITGQIGSPKLKPSYQPLETTLKTEEVIARLQRKIQLFGRRLRLSLESGDTFDRPAV